MRWDTVEIFFTDGTRTIEYVSEEEDIGQAVANVADYEDAEVRDYRIIDTVEETIEL